MKHETGLPTKRTAFPIDLPLEEVDVGLFGLELFLNLVSGIVAAIQSVLKFMTPANIVAMWSCSRAVAGAAWRHDADRKCIR